MPKKEETASFVLRFTQKIYQNEAGEPQVQWRGHIQHVQSDAEQRFSDMEDAMRFVQAKLADLTMQAVAGKTPEEQKGILAQSFDLWRKMAAETPKLVRESIKDPRKQVANIQEQMQQQLQQVGEVINQRIGETISEVDEWRGASKGDYKNMVRLLEKMSDDIAELNKKMDGLNAGKSKKV